MEGISGAASAITLASVVGHLIEGCIKLYNFWASIKTAPAEVKTIMMDLLILSEVLEECSGTVELSASETQAIRFLGAKMQIMEDIVTNLTSRLASTSKTERLWSALKISVRSKSLQQFQQSLNDTKCTLLIALTSQSVRKADLCASRLCPKNVLLLGPNRIARPPKLRWSTSVVDSRTERPSIVPLNLRDSSCPEELNRNADSNASIVLEESKIAFQTLVRDSLAQSVDGLFRSEVLDRLLQNSCLDLMATQSTAPDNHKPSKIAARSTASPSQRCRPSVQSGGAELGYRCKRTRIVHRSSCINFGLNKVWIRCSTRKFEVGLNQDGKLEFINSIIIYPSSWLIRLGLCYAAEAQIFLCPLTGLSFRISPIRVVPDNSLIFEFCRAGNIDAARTLLEERRASVRDTNSQGYTPLHFAATHGNVDLCKYLIDNGADPEALAYEGPTELALSPITMFVESCQTIGADKKISMFRLFDEQIDLSDPDSDGWTIVYSIGETYNREQVPIPENSTSWFCERTSKERFVAITPRAIWYGVQYGARAYIVHERNSRLLEKLLYIHTPSMTKLGWSIAHWLALRAAQHEVLHLCLEAGQYLRLDGFDSSDEGALGTQLPRPPHILNEAWCSTLPRCLRQMEAAIELELERLLTRTSWSREHLVSLLMQHQVKPVEAAFGPDIHTCTGCNNDFSALGLSLVKPRHIEISEYASRHGRGCVYDQSDECAVLETSQQDEIMPGFPSDKGPRDQSNASALQSHNRHFAAAVEGHGQEMFEDTALFLYRVQGRRWLSDLPYELSDRLCATCFLGREGYIGEEENLATGLTRMPAAYGVRATSE